MLVDEEPRAVLAPALLVARQHEDDVACWRLAVARHSEHGRDEHRHAALHVERAATPDLAVDELAGERRMAPLSGFGGNDVYVAVEEKRRCVPPSWDSRDKVRPAGVTSEESRLDAALRGAPRRSPAGAPLSQADSTCRSGAAAAGARRHRLMCQRSRGRGSAERLGSNASLQGRDDSHFAVVAVESLLPPPGSRRASVEGETRVRVS